MSPFIFWRSTLIIFSHLRLRIAIGFSPSGHPSQNPVCYASLLSPILATCPAHIILLDLVSWKIFGEYRSWSSSLCNLLHFPRPSEAHISSSEPYFRTPSAYVPFSIWQTRFHTRKKQVAKLFFWIHILNFIFFNSKLNSCPIQLLNLLTLLLRSLLYASRFSVPECLDFDESKVNLWRISTFYVSAECKTRSSSCSTVQYVQYFTT
jgi:hypothetical protein